MPVRKHTNIEYTHLHTKNTKARNSLQISYNYHRNCFLSPFYENTVALSRMQGCWSIQRDRVILVTSATALQKSGFINNGNKSTRARDDSDGDNCPLKCTAQTYSKGHVFVVNRVYPKSTSLPVEKCAMYTCDSLNVTLWPSGERGRII